MTLRVAGLFRYPVKSMLGEELQAGDVGADGLAGDRRFGLIEHETGLVASAKQPRKWAPLLQCRARLLDDGRVEIALPDGTTKSSGDADMSSVLSDFVGRRVSLGEIPPADPHLERLWPSVEGLAPPAVVRSDPYATAMAAAAPGTFFDYAPLHVITTATLNRLRAEGDADFDAARFRPNVILDTSAEGFVEQGWVGHRLLLGQNVVLEVINHTPRCAVPALSHGDLPRNLDVLRTVVAQNRVTVNGGRFACAGVYARVLQAGTLAVNDAASLRAPS